MSNSNWSFGTNVLESAASWLTVAVLGGMAWLVRRVFTNQKQIEALEAHLKNRDELRQRDREDIQEVKAKLDTLTNHLLRK